MADEKKFDGDPKEDNLFETLYPKYTYMDVIEFRDMFFDCSNSATRTTEIDCDSKDTFNSIKLIMETARMNGYLRACGSDEWWLYFGNVTHRIHPIFKTSNENAQLLGGMLHGTIQGKYVRITTDKNLCGLIPPNEDKEEFLASQALYFFNSRIIDIMFSLSYPQPPFSY